MWIRSAWALAGMVISIFAAPVAYSDPSTDCASVLGNDWTSDEGLCRGVVTSDRAATMTMTALLPDELLAQPPSGPVLRSYLRQLADGWRTTGRSMVRDSEYRVLHERFIRGSVTSIVFEESWQTVGTTPNRAFRTFTFDLATGRQLELADLFGPGIDPLTALPPLIRPYLEPALDAAPPPHDPGTYPFTPQEWEPQPDGSGYAGQYRAFALTSDELILYLPDAPMAHETPWPRDRFVWSMDGGTVTVRVPLSALASILAV